MDDLIKRFGCARDRDLMLCMHRGVAYQADMRAGRAEYGAEYFRKVAAYEGGEIATAVNAGRCALVARHAAPDSTILDVGAGTGAFVRAARSWGFPAVGFDVMPAAVAALRSAGLYDEDPAIFDVVTMWDTIEHLEDPILTLRRVRKGALLCASIPVFDDLRRIRESKHYRPGEHLYYWTAQGFIDWMALWGFRLLEQSTHEVDAGRESIGAFAFRRDLPDYHDHILAYQQMHAERFYGSSATELHLQSVAAVVRKLEPASILDFGCGRSDLVAHFWCDGGRRLARYDPAIPQYKRLPAGPFDLCLVCDVMEHVPMAYVHQVLTEVRSVATTALFTISTKLARAKLPDGRNAHVTLLTRDEWTRWIADVFGAADVLPSKWETELIVLGRPRTDG